jgi:peptidoglycan/LPS O-acetylase OafA/YrhL
MTLHDTQTTTRPPADGTTPGAARLRSLDGLRGIAAAVVVLHHLTLIAGPVLHGIAGATDPWSAWWIMQHSPLKLLTAGREAVVVFFVLSGLVVPLPALRNGSFSWPGFAASRFVRLFLPAWGALVLAASLVLVVPRVAAQVSGGEWIAEKTATTMSWKRFVAELTLNTGGSHYDNVLWTLRWEVAFSFLLPLLIVLVAVLARWWAPAAALAVGVSTFGIVANVSALAYLPMFFLGMLIGTRLDAIRGWSDRVPARISRPVWGSVLVVSSLLLVCAWLLEPVVPASSTGGKALIGLETAGAAGLVVAAIGSDRWRRFLEWPSVQFLGRISFSLYLVHVPVLVALTYLVGDWNWWLLGPIGIPLVLGTAWLFFRFVERPTHRLARAASTGAARAVVAYTERRVRSA